MRQRWQHRLCQRRFSAVAPWPRNRRDRDDSAADYGVKIEAQFSAGEQ